ncbi:MAG: hypothetical protein NZ518_06910, partial [Dehalococcoidia bacterium]|nr:hypothetical protein [Dehalococcoidia bacterium]
PAPFIPAPPPGRVLPRNAFFNVWRSTGGPAGRLGWAITEETGFASDAQPYERGIAFAGNNQVLFVNIDGTYERVPVP